MNPCAPNERDTHKQENHCAGITSHGEKWPDDCTSSDTENDRWKTAIHATPFITSEPSSRAQSTQQTIRNSLRSARHPLRKRISLPLHLCARDESRQLQADVLHMENSNKSTETTNHRRTVRERHRTSVTSRFETRCNQRIVRGENASACHCTSAPARDESRQQ